MKTTLGLTLPFALSVIAPLTLVADGTVRTNPPSMCTAPTGGCGCGEASGDADSVTNACIKVSVGLGETTPWTGSLPCALKIFADDNAPSIFTEESLHATLGGYTFKRLGQKTLADGETPAEVVFSHPYGEEVRFVFPEGESWGRPDPTVHIEMDERLMMVDAEGWAATSDPVYYDLYVGDGTRRRFLATNMTGALGSLVSVTDAHGATITTEEMGVDLVYGMSGVRQFLTPSRLANVALAPERDGYDVFVYAVDAPPQKDAATGLYATPDATPLKHLSIRSRNGGKRAVVTFARNGGDAKTYVFDYVMGEWSLARESGVKEEKERQMQDKVRAQIVKAVKSKDGELLARTEMNFKWMSWGFAPTNRVEGFGGVTDTTSWTYYTSGNGRGQVKTESRQSGLLIQYAYDNVDRVISETRSGPDMMTEKTTYDYTPVDASDPVLPVDTRPRTIVRKLNGIECERTYYVYSPLTNIVERVGTQGAAYGSTNVLRTVTAFYPVVANDLRSGLVRSIRHEDGKLDLYDYSLVSNTWTRTVTHLHEQSPSPVSGKTTRDITIINSRSEATETRTEAYIDGIWYTIARNRMTYNAEGKRTSLENLAGQVTTTAWDCCHKVSETEPDGSTTTWDYDDEGRMIASSRLIPLDMTNVTWLTTCYEYDALGRQTATWQTNFAAQVGLPVERTRYDALGRVIASVDQLGNTTTTTYSPDGRTVSVHNPNTSTRVLARSADGDTLSIIGTAVTPEFHTYDVTNLDVAATPSSSQTQQIPCCVRETRYGSASSPRFTRTFENLLGQTIREERSGFQGAVLATSHSYDSLGRLVSTTADYEPTTEYTYDDIGNRITSFDLGTNRTYIANCLNQYTQISNHCDSASLREEFHPQFDDDGNQTLVKTATGIWSVTYNGENRPVQWSNGSTNIVMSFDRMGRRVVKNAQRFVYDGYLQIANFDSSATNSQLTALNSQLFIWDPTEPIATRPLVWKCGAPPAYYVHDGNKNVSEVVTFEGDISAHYEYAPFGAVCNIQGESALVNSWRFSSECAEDDSATVYYNYRHYEQEAGRWLQRDKIVESGGVGLYVFCGNCAMWHVDSKGLKCSITIYAGHSTTTQSLLSDLAKKKIGPTECGDMIGIVSCFRDKMNAEVDRKFPGHVIPGIPREPGSLHKDEVGNNPNNDELASKGIQRAWDAALKAAQGLGEKCCCIDVKISVLCDKAMKNTARWIEVQAMNDPVYKDHKDFNWCKRKGTYSTIGKVFTPEY